MHIDTMLYNSRPEGTLSEIETRIYDQLDQLAIPYARASHEHADTIEACKEIEAILGAQICKNLVVCNAQKTLFFLVMMPGDKKFLTKLLSKQLGTARLSFASADDLDRLLRTTPGSVSVLELIADASNQVGLVIDEDLMEQDCIGCHPGTNTATLKLKTSDILEVFLPSTGHKPTFVKL